MATDFPGGLQAFSDVGTGDDITASNHNTIQDTIEALEAKVGITSSAVVTSLDYLLKNPSSTTPGHLHTTLGTITTGTLSTGAVIGGVTMTLSSDATGDIYYRNASGVLTRLAISGTEDHVLSVSSGGLPEWAAAAGGSNDFTGKVRIDASNATTALDVEQASTGDIATFSTSAVWDTFRIFPGTGDYVQGYFSGSAGLFIKPAGTAGGILVLSILDYDDNNLISVNAGRAGEDNIKIGNNGNCAVELHASTGVEVKGNNRLYIGDHSGGGSTRSYLGLDTLNSEEGSMTAFIDEDADNHGAFGVKIQGGSEVAIFSSRYVSVGIASLAAAATEGFPAIPHVDGPPSATPVAPTGMASIAFEVGNNKLWIYNSTGTPAWKYVTLS